MSVKDCIKLKKSLDSEDLENFNAQYEELVAGGIPKEAAYAEAAEGVMENLLDERNELATEIVEKGGYLETLTIENLLNPASYKPTLRGGASDIANISSDEFDALMDEVEPRPEKDTPVLKETEPKPAPKGEMSEDQASMFVRRRNTKKLGKEKVKTLRRVAKAASIDGQSSMNKADLVEALKVWHEALKLDRLPKPSEKAAQDLRASFYTRADSSVGVVVTSRRLESQVKSDNKGFEFVEVTGDAAMEAWARNFGGSVEKKADTYEGGKTGKGIHFQGTQDFVNFVKAYTGMTLKEESRLSNGGEPIHVNYQEEQITNSPETYAVGDKVTILNPHYNGRSGKIVDIIEDIDGEPIYGVAFDDPETGQEFIENFTPNQLEPLEVPVPDKKAAAILKEAAKHGVSGADEALTGLANLFGGKGKFSSGFTFDEETYAKAKPHFKKALEEFIAAGKSLKEFVQYILENFGQGVKPYLRQFHQDIASDKITVRGINDVQPTTQEQATTSTVRQEQAGEVDTANAGGDTATVPGETGGRPATEEGTPVGSVGLPVDSAIDVGEQGDTGILGKTGEFPSESGTTRPTDTGRGAADRTKGVPTETPGSKKAQADARASSSRQKLKPSTSTWIQSDRGNIAESLPQLFPEQQDDVVFAEQRLFDNNARGVMFTNGTGTGKTYTGMGLVKRMVMQGKDNIIIIVPGTKVADDWIKSARPLELNITKLKGIKDAGQGVVITTYANISENDEIVNRNWDLVVHDEAHKLSENAGGNSTNALDKSRAITGHPNGRMTYAESMEPELMGQIRFLRTENEVIKDPFKNFADKYGEQKSTKQTPILRRAVKNLQIAKHASLPHEALLKALEAHRSKVYKSIGGPENAGDRVLQNTEKLEPLLTEFNRRRKEIHNPNRVALWETKTPKRLDLTATPFAYDKSVDHAEGFLFEYDRSKDAGRGYNDPDARGSFFVEHFGYRMRYGKLTQPEAEVDSSLMEREFNAWLKGQGALRGRRLTVDHDYSREFVAIDDLVGNKIDEGYTLIQESARDKDNPDQAGWEIMMKKLQKHFNYHARVRMLEAIKAGHVVERVRQHQALGRKVVIFHSRIQGGTINPFSIFAPMGTMEDGLVKSTPGSTQYDAELQSYNNAAKKFNEMRPDLVNLQINQVRPLDLFAQEFGDQLTVYNGTITDKAKINNPDEFNRDNGEIQIIAVQDEGGKEGISLHDATGANQRVLINMGLPVRPTQAIQIEGRIYRVGQESNAIFEYLNTGTNFERITFAEKISQRASTAENLALGDEARGLKDSFIDAYEDPTYGPPSDAQGVGGGELDRANWGATSEFERAKTHYFGTLKTKGKRNQREGIDYFATPEPLGMKMVEWAGLRPNESILEPSAGHGAIARYIPEDVTATYVEPSNELLSRLALRATGNLKNIQFEDLDVGGNKYDAVVMNPPFGSGGSTAIKHLQKAMHHLKNGGRIVALIPEGPASDKKFDAMFYGKEGELEQVREALKKKRREGESYAAEVRRIEDLTKFHLRANISLPPITFTRAGTAIKARIVVIDKVMNEQADIINQPSRDIHVDTINELFDRIEDMSVPERSDQIQSPADYLLAEGLTVTYNDTFKQWLVLGKTFEHKTLIRKAVQPIGGQWSAINKKWVSPEDPTQALYNEFISPTPDAAAPQKLWEKPATQEFKSTDASINRNLNPVTIGIVEKNYGWESGTVNADIGGGMHDNTVLYMEGLGIEHVIYDPWNRSDVYNADAVSKIRDGKADTVTINNTLNVIKEREVRKQVLLEAENALKPGGSIYIQIYEGDKSGIGRNTRGDIWQENRTANDFLDEVKEIFSDAEIKYGLIQAQRFIAARKPSVSTDIGAEVAARAKALFAGRGGKLPSTLGGLIVTEGKTKAGKQVWEVTGNTREHKDLLKSLGGRWYGPKKAWAFYTSNPTEKIKAKLPAPLMKRGGREGGVSVKQVREWLKTPLRRISSRIDIVIVDRISDSKVDYYVPDDAMGWYFNGKAYLAAENIHTPADAIEALTHETVGHLGLEGVLGRRKTTELLGDVTNMKLEETLSPGTHPEIASVLDNLRKTYVDENGEYALDDRQEAKEIIAHIAHSKPRVGPFVEIYNKIINWFKQQLARWGFGDTGMVQIENALAQSVDYLRNPPAGRIIRAEKMGFDTSTVWYHGTNADIDEFKHLHPVRNSPFSFFTRYPDTASVFAQSHPSGRANVVPVYLNQGKVFDYANVDAKTQKTLEIGIREASDNRSKAIELIQGVARGSWFYVEDTIVQNILRGLGFNSFYTMEQGQKNIAIYDPKNIRSINARFELGDSASADILAMRKPVKGPSDVEKEAYRKLGLGPKETTSLWQKISNFQMKNLTEALSNATGRRYEGLFDGLIEGLNYERELGVGMGKEITYTNPQTGKEEKTLDYENSAYISARLATGIADNMSHILHYGPLQWKNGVPSPIPGTRGLLALFGELGGENLNDWLLWMGAHRAEWLMKQGRERNLTKAEIQAGKNIAGAREELFVRIKDEFMETNKAFLDFNEEAGLINKESRKTWEGPYYVPFYRISDDELQAPTIKRGLSHQSSGIRHLYGGEMETNDLLENILINVLKLTDSAVKAHALRLMVDNFKDSPYLQNETMRFTKALVPKSEIRKRIMQDREFAKQVAEYLGLTVYKDTMNPKTGKMEPVNTLDLISEVNKTPGEGFEMLWALTAPKDPDIIRVKRDGKNEYWRIVGAPGLLRFVGNIDRIDTSNKGMRAARWFKRLLTTGVTVAPDFMLANFIRDAVQAAVISKDKMLFGVDSLKGLAGALKEDSLYQAIVASGASFQGGYVHATDPEASAQIMRRELEKKGLTRAAINAHMGSILNTPAKLKSVVLRGWQHWRSVGDKVENANRYATVKRALDAGKPVMQAMFEGKDLMDYSRRGNYSVLIGFTDVLPFVNARLQGVDRTVRAVKQDPIMVARRIAYIAAFSIILAELNDDDDRYKELPDWEKDAYWHFWIDIGGPLAGHYRIPKPFELGVFAGTIPERMWRVWVTESQPSDKLRWSLVQGLMETLSLNPIPQIVLPLSEIWANESFYFDRPIESESDKSVIVKERYNEYTSPTARILSNAGLGGEGLPEWLQLSPKQIQHIWNGYTGSIGAYALKAADMLVRGVGDYPTTTPIMPEDLPGIRRIYQGTRKKRTVYEEDMYKRLKEVRKIQGTIRSLLEQGRLDDARTYQRTNAEKLAYRTALESRAKIFSLLKKRRDEVLRNDKFSPIEKYQKSQDIQGKINTLAKRIEAETRAAF